MLVVREDSSTFEAFVTPPIPIYMQFWLFNVTNPNDVKYRGAKPNLVDVGPYTYEWVQGLVIYTYTNTTYNRSNTTCDISNLTYCEV